jgi:hypothetical protein
MTADEMINIALDYRILGRCFELRNVYEGSFHPSINSTRALHLYFMRSEVSDWLAEQQIRYILHNNDTQNDHHIAFYSDQDAVAFKLRWL